MEELGQCLLDLPGSELAKQLIEGVPLVKDNLSKVYQRISFACSQNNRGLDLRLLDLGERGWQGAHEEGVARRH